MTPLDFAAKKIVFDEASPITGAFDIRKYRMLEKPLRDLDNIHIKRMVWYKASSALGTVALQIALSWMLTQRVGNIVAVMQSDDDAKDWMATRGRKWLKRIPGVMDLLSNEKYNATLGRWLFCHQWLLVTGPGENAQQSKQCAYLLTDESHVTAFEEGDLASFEERMSKKWNRLALHVTTAADAGKEVDRYYYDGQQNEWHFRCPKCAELVWPLWAEDSKEKYGNYMFGEDDNHVVFWRCPLCEYIAPDNARSRYALHEHGDYVPQNPNAPVESQSYRWNTFAAHWISWSEALSKYREAIEAAKLGNLQPLENFEKKRLCKSYTPRIPDFGNTKTGGYKCGDVQVIDNNERRFCSFDFQEGRGAEGVHWWGLCDQFERSGDSKRVAFNRLESWADCRGFQLSHGVADIDTYCDAGHRDKEVFAKCAQWHWYALISSDSELFHHTVTIVRKPVQVPNPYFTQTQPQDSMSGQKSRIIRKRGIVPLPGQRLPLGWCYSRTWSKPNIGFLLLRLKSGLAGVEYGIASDIAPEYTSQLNSYMETYEVVKRTNTRRRVLKQIREDDHSFACSCQNVIAAMVRGYFPLAKLETETKQAA